MNKLILGILSLMLFPGCSKDNTSVNPEIPNADDEGVEVSFSSGVAASISSNLTMTRAILEGAIPTNSSVGIYGIPALYAEKEKYTIEKFVEEGDFQQYLFNAKYDATEVSQTTSSLKQAYKAKFPSNQSGMDALSFYAYYPYIEKPVYKSKLGYGVPITINNDNMSQITDYLYTNQTVARISLKPVELKFQHALARLDFKIYSDKADLQIPGQKVKINSIIIKAICSNTGIMYLKNGTIAPTNTDETAYTYPLTNTYIKKATTAGDIEILDPIASFLLIPAGDCITSITLSLTPEGQDIADEYIIYTMQAADNRIILSGGNVITMNVLYTPRDAVVSSKLTQWNTIETRSFSIKQNNP